MYDVTSGGGVFIPGDRVKQVAQIGLSGLTIEEAFVKGVELNGRLILTKQVDGPALTDRNGDARMFPARAFQKIAS